MKVILTFLFPETGDNHPDVLLNETDLLMIPNVGDRIAVGTFFGNEVYRVVTERAFRFREETRVIVLICR